MKSVLAVFVSVCFAEIIQVYGEDIGYHCHSDLDCKIGNGGNFSKCDSYSSVCVCTHDYLGNENIPGLNEDYMKCYPINYCEKNNGSRCCIGCRPIPEGTQNYLKFLESQQLDGELKEDFLCQSVIYCNGKATCSIGLVPKAFRRVDSNKDWYGRIQKELVSDFIPDTNTSVCYDPERAVNSRPEGMVIKTSVIPGAGLGVFTEKFVSRGTMYGPYKGRRVYHGIYNIDMSWTIETLSGVLQVDADDKSNSNWLRYINMPNDAESENLSALQYEGEIYYFAFKPIQPGSELLVWYGDNYARRLGIKKHKRPKYTYGEEGHHGGKCSSFGCYGNSICIGGFCLCKNGSHARGSDCITDETVGGKCFGENDALCKNDDNAVCWDGVCFCNDDSSELNRKCVLDEMAGGVCEGNQGQECVFDSNAVCINRSCSCKKGTQQVGQKCQRNEHPGGFCIGVDGTPCTGDSTSVCSKGVCTCDVGSSAFAGKCVKDGSLKGFCKAEKCEGKNVVCSINTYMCVCKRGYLEKGRKCVN